MLQVGPPPSPRPWAPGGPGAGSLVFPNQSLFRLDRRDHGQLARACTSSCPMEPFSPIGLLFPSTVGTHSSSDRSPCSMCIDLVVVVVFSSLLCVVVQAACWGFPSAAASRDAFCFIRSSASHWASWSRFTKTLLATSSSWVVFIPANPSNFWSLRRISVYD